MMTHPHDAMHSGGGRHHFQPHQRIQLRGSDAEAFAEADELLLKLQVVALDRQVILEELAQKASP